MTSNEDVARITAAVAENFQSFGGGQTRGADFNPLVTWLKDKPPQFAMGVNIEDVVRFVLEAQ